MIPSARVEVDLEDRSPRHGEGRNFKALRGQNIELKKTFKDRRVHDARLRIFTEMEQILHARWAKYAKRTGELRRPAADIRLAGPKATAVYQKESRDWHVPALCGGAGESMSTSLWM